MRSGKRVTRFFAALLALCMLPVGSALADPATPSATVTDVTINGTVGTQLVTQTVTITLQGDVAFRIGGSLPRITNAPEGIVQTVVASDGSRKMTISLMGTPLQTTSAPLSIVIPADAVSTNASITVTTNPNAKWSITGRLGTATPIGLVFNTSPLTKPPAAKETVSYVVNASKLNLRTAPTTKENNIIAQLKKGDKVEVIAIEKGWAEVDYADGLRYAAAKYLTPVNVDGTSTNAVGISTMTVTCRTLNIRAGAGTTYSKLGVLTRGDTVTVLEVSNGWAKIDLGNGKIGYVSTRYLA